MALPRPVRVYHGAEENGIGGPKVKLHRMQKYFPNCQWRYNIIYSVGATVEPELCIAAGRRGVKIVCHINSVNHAAYSPATYRDMNLPIQQNYFIADHIVYGSEHARKGAEIFLGESETPSSIVYNAVDTASFSPRSRPADRFNILAAGLHTIRHRLDPIIWALPMVRRRYPHARLIIAGPLVPGSGVFDCGEATIRRLVQEAGIEPYVEFTGRYTQADAPDIYNCGDVLVHLKHMDWTPNAAIEGMACGLPVIHAGNGGMPELVGDAGVSLGLPFDWDRIHCPDPVLLAEGIMETYERRSELGEIARRRAVERYDMQHWVAAHHRIFAQVLDQ